MPSVVHVLYSWPPPLYDENAIFALSARLFIRLVVPPMLNGSGTV